MTAGRTRWQVGWDTQRYVETGTGIFSIMAAMPTASGVDRGGSRTPHYARTNFVSNQKKMHAIVLRLYTYGILFATSIDCHEAPSACVTNNQLL